MQTATNPQTGEKMVLQGGQWVPLQGASQQSGPMVIGTPRAKPKEAPSGYRYSAGGNLEIIPGGPADPNKPAAPSAPPHPIQQANTEFDNSSNLRKEFNALPGVKDYGASLGALGSMWKAPDNAQGDLAVVYGFAKVMDPGSVVREGEMDMANSTSSMVQDIYRKYGQISEGNRLPPEVRKQLILTAVGKGRALNEAYSQERSRYRSIAQQRGFNPDEILGNHLGDAFQGAEGEFRQEAGIDKPPVSTDEDVRQFIIQYQSLPVEDMQLLAKAKLGRSIDNLPEVVAHLKATGVLSNKVVTNQPDPTIDGMKSGVGDIVEGVGDVLGLVGNPLNAGINLATGANLSTDLGQTFRDASGLPDNSNPYAKAINTGGAAALTGAGAAGAASRLLGGAGRAAVDQLAAEPIRQGIAGAGAGAGTEAARQNNLGPLGQIAAGVAGGMGAYGGTNALLKLGGGSAPSEIAQIAQRQGVDMMPADVGGPNTRRITAAAAQTPLSAEPVVNAAKKTQAQLKDATQRAAGQAGGVMQPDDAGESVRQAGKAYVPKQSARIGRVYDRAQERAKGVKIKPLGALKVLDDQIARMEQTGEIAAPLVNNLKSLRRSIEGGLSVSGIRDVRTILSQGVYDGKLRSSQEKAIYKDVVEAVRGDIETGLSAAGRKDALNLFRVADNAWKERIEYVDEVLEPVIGGKKSGEDVLSAIERMGQGKSGGVSRLAGIFREMPEDVAGNVRATIIDRLGTARAGQQDATGEAFSSNEFLTNWSRLSPKGKAILFGDGELRRNLDEIGKLAGQVKEGSKYANSSNSSGGVMGNVGALAVAGMSFPRTALAAGVLQHATGRLMASKEFTKWLARVPNNPALLKRHEGQLAQIAAREPVIANDIASVQQFLSGQSYRAAAGSEGQSEDRR